MTRPMTRKKKKVAAPKKTEKFNPPFKPLRNKLYEDILSKYRGWMNQPATVFMLANIMVDMRKMGLKNIQIMIFPDPSPDIPRFRFDYRGKTYIWSETCMVQE